MFMKATELSEDRVNWGKVGLVMMAWGLVSFIFAGFFTVTQKSDKYTIPMMNPGTVDVAPEARAAQPPNQVGPIIAERPGETWQIFVRARIPENRWNFIEIEVLDEYEEYLYSFGQELWHETGRDSDGNWREKRSLFETNVTFPQAGIYYLNFWSEKRYKANDEEMYVRVTKRNGSNVLHTWAGIILALMGLIMLEIEWGFFRKAFEAMNEKD